MLRKIGVRYVQGYYFSRPIPGARFLEQFCDLDVFSDASVNGAKKNDETAKELVAAEAKRVAKMNETEEKSEENDKKVEEKEKTEKSVNT